MTNCLCINCGKNAWDWEKEFWQKNMGFKDKDPYCSYCKDCCCDTIDLDDIESFRPLCQELDIPYIKRDLGLILGFKFSLTKKVVIGRYIAKMRLKNFYPFHYEDSDNFNEVWK